MCAPVQPTRMYTCKAIYNAVMCRMGYLGGFHVLGLLDSAYFLLFMLSSFYVLR